MHHGHVLIYIGNQYSKYPFGTQCSRVLLTMPRSIKIRKNEKPTNNIVYHITTINHIKHIPFKSETMPRGNESHSM